MLPERYSVNGKKRQYSGALKWHAKEGYKQRAICLIKYELYYYYYFSNIVVKSHEQLVNVRSIEM